MIYQDGDKIIVTELRPMSEATKDGSYILLMSHSHKIFTAVGYDLDGEFFVIPGIGRYTADQFLGWLPMPIYQPYNKK